MNNVTKLTLIAAWPLFFGLMFIAAANGLTGTLLSVRASIESFPVFITGLVMSCYYGGFLAGSFITPKLVRRVGHIRVFAAMASLSSTTILLHGLFVNEISWAAMRVITGFTYAGMYVVAESWLNDISNNKNRGVILSTYMTISHAAFFASQFMLNLAPPESLSLFIMISVIVSIALLPIALIPRTAPKIEDPQPIEFKALFEASPTGILTVFSGGFIGATMLTIGPLYFLESGIKIQSIGLMISAYILGGLLGQIPMGILSDLMPRRRLLLGMLCISSISALIFYVLHSQSNDILILYIALTCLGITGNTMHAVAVAYTNDSLEPEQYVTASSALIMINGLGTLTGPILISSCLALIGNDILFLLLSGMFALIFVIALMRSFISKATPMEDQADYISLPSSTTMISAQIADED